MQHNSSALQAGQDVRTEIHNVARATGKIEIAGLRHSRDHLTVTLSLTADDRPPETQQLPGAVVDAGRFGSWATVDHIAGS
jgi:hypothetical protein